MTGNPFLIEGPAVVSFSGGRTSGYMLRRILDAHGGTLPNDVHVLFANTGDEHEGTLNFVRECGERWGVRVRWIEHHILRVWRPNPSQGPRWLAAVGRGKVDTRPLVPMLTQTFREVSYDTASRRGEPFDALIDSRHYLPNPVARFCTDDLKSKPIAMFMAAQGYTRWALAMGLRADEPRRLAKMKARMDAGEDIALPLAEGQIAREDVLRFWQSQPFDLRIPPGAGNCVGCFMKGAGQLIDVFASDPDAAERWVARERRIGATVRSNRPPYAVLASYARRQLRMFEPSAEAESSLPCACGD